MHLLQVLVWVGVFYVAKLAVSAVLDLWDGLQAFVLPKIWRRDLTRYTPGKRYLWVRLFCLANMVPGLW